MNKTPIILAALCAVVCLARAEAWASSTPLRPGRIVHQSQDASGTTTRVFYASPTDVTVEIRNRRVSIQKHFTLGRTETLIQAGAERLRLVLDSTGLVAETMGGSVRSRGTEADVKRVRALLSRSRALREATTILQQTPVSTATPLAPLVLTTKAFLESLLGDTSGYTDVSRWVRRSAAPSDRVVKVADGPGDCWNEYVKEAVAAYDELMDCVANLHWYDIGGSSACHLIYDMRAIGAFSWWLNCTALHTA